MNYGETEQVKLTDIDIYFSAPFNTYIFLELDEALSRDRRDVQDKLTQELNNNPQFKIPEVIWGTEDSNTVKKAKGVFSTVGKDNSFLCARLTQPRHIKIKTCSIRSLFPPGSLQFNEVKFYIHESGLGTCTAKVTVKHAAGLTLEELETVSEELNVLYKNCFAEPCFRLALAYSKAVERLSVKYFNFDYIPALDEKRIEDDCIPWTHRVYHIHSNILFELDNPGNLFQNILTPSKKGDVRDFSIYENRYIYFGWGHSIIITRDGPNPFVQTQSRVREYVSLIEISQSHWHCFDLLTLIVEQARITFNSGSKKLGIKKLKRNILDIHRFNKCVDQILDNARTVKVTFDTEKRNLLKEMHDIWQMNEMLEKVKQKMAMIEGLLDFLYHNQKEQQQGRLNTILLFITVLSISQAIAIVIDYINPIFTFDSITKLLILGTGTLVIALAIYLLSYIRS